MGNKVRVKARQTRGSGTPDAYQSLKEILVDNYDNTKVEYDALDDETKAKFDEVLGGLSDPFKQNAMMVELELNVVETSGDADKRLEQLNEVLDVCGDD